MRCGSVEPLVEKLVDGGLEPAVAREVETHVTACRRCTARVDAARRLLTALAAEPAVRAPAGFTDAVMDAVYREALVPRDSVRGVNAGGVREAADAGMRTPVWGQLAAARVGTARPLPVLRVYRRLGLSFVITAAVLTASLLVPRIAYPTLLTEHGIGAGLGAGGAVAVQSTLESAGEAMRGLMGGNASAGGTTR